jgi:hypothetical protein
MNKHENRQRKKNEALNKIRKIYHPKYSFPYDKYCSETGAEQRESAIKCIILELEQDLKAT